MLAAAFHKPVSELQRNLKDTDLKNFRDRTFTKLNANNDD